MNEKLLSSFERAASANDPADVLYALAVRMRDDGKSKDEVYALFEEYRARLRAEGREREEDATMGIMDLITGFCSPHVAIFPATPRK